MPEAATLSAGLPTRKDEAWRYAAVEALYREGGNSVNSDGSIRTIAGFAGRDDRNPDHQEFFGTDTPLDDFVTSAIDGTGAFAGEPDLVRRQGIEKGVQNATMVAWTIHELDAALAKAADGDFDRDPARDLGAIESRAFRSLGLAVGGAPTATSVGLPAVAVGETWGLQTWIPSSTSPTGAAFSNANEIVVE